ncbi:hypothetical protein PInf_017928 [Phytophthora infestans]|nr:hypothetical protein PInf_017928 [Phytophthora infestans]
MDKNDFSHLNDSQFESVWKMAGIFGMEALQSLVVSAPAEQLERANAFDAYEQGLIAHVRENRQAPAAETNPPNPKPIRLKFRPYEGKEGVVLPGCISGDQYRQVNLDLRELVNREIRQRRQESRNLCPKASAESRLHGQHVQLMLFLEFVSSQWRIGSVVQRAPLN